MEAPGAQVGRDAKSRSMMALAGGLSLLVLAIAVAVIWFVSYLQNESARLETFGNGKELGLALMGYVADYGERFPPTMAYPAQFLQEIGELREADFDSANPRGGYLAGNRHLEGRTVSELADDYASPIFIETEEWRNGERLLGQVVGTPTWAEGEVAVRAMREGTLLDGRPLFKEAE